MAQRFLKQKRVRQGHMLYSVDAIPRNSLFENNIIQQITVKEGRSQGTNPLVFKLAERASSSGYQA